MPHISPVAAIAGSARVDLFCLLRVGFFNAHPCVFWFNSIFVMNKLLIEARSVWFPGIFHFIGSQIYRHLILLYSIVFRIQMLKARLS